MKTKVLRLAAVGCVLSLAIAGTSVAVRMTSAASADSTASLAAQPPVDPLEAAIRTAERLVHGRAAELKATPADAFTTTPDGLWRSVLRRQLGELALVSTFPDDPSLN